MLSSGGQISVTKDVNPHSLNDVQRSGHCRDRDNHTSFTDFEPSEASYSAATGLTQLTVNT